MFVLEGSTSDPWTSNYTMKAELDTYDQFAIDGTYFRHSTGLYHVYSCWFVIAINGTALESSSLTYPSQVPRLLLLASQPVHHQDERPLDRLLKPDRQTNRKQHLTQPTTTQH